MDVSHSETNFATHLTISPSKERCFSFKAWEQVTDGQDGREGRQVLTVPYVPEGVGLPFRRGVTARKNCRKAGW